MVESVVGWAGAVEYVGDDRVWLPKNPWRALGGSGRTKGPWPHAKGGNCAGKDKEDLRNKKSPPVPARPGLHHTEVRAGDAPKPQFSIISIENQQKSNNQHLVNHKNYPLFLTLANIQRAWWVGRRFTFRWRPAPEGCRSSAETRDKQQLVW